MCVTLPIMVYSLGMIIDVVQFRQGILEQVVWEIDDRICWNPLAGHSGIWAGDRITITTLQSAQRKYKGWAEWVDITPRPFYASNTPS